MADISRSQAETQGLLAEDRELTDPSYRDALEYEQQRPNINVGLARQAAAGDDVASPKDPNPTQISNPEGRPGDSLACVFVIVGVVVSVDQMKSTESKPDEDLAPRRINVDHYPLE